MSDKKIKVLTVIDMQYDFLTGSLANWDADRVKSAVIKKIANDKWDYIIFTRDTHFKSNYFETNEGKNLPVLHCVRETPGWCIDTDIFDAAVETNSVVKTIDKSTFASSSLIRLLKDIVLQSDGNDCDITFVGVCTGICVVSNALLAKNDSAIDVENVNIIVDAECCSCLSKETHDAAILTMKTCQIEVINDKK